MSVGDEAKRPHNETFVRLGRSVWFTLEHSQRARGAGSQLDEGLSHAKKENDEISRMGLSWMGVGDFGKSHYCVAMCIWSDMASIPQEHLVVVYCGKR